MTPTMNQVSVAGRELRLSAGAIQTIQHFVKSVFTAAEEQEQIHERRKEVVLFRLRKEIYHLEERAKGCIVLVVINSELNRYYLCNL